MASELPSNGSLYGKVLSRDGTLGLMAVMLLTFFIYVYSNSLESMHEVHMEQTKVLKEILAEIRHQRWDGESLAVPISQKSVSTPHL